MVAVRLLKLILLMALAHNLPVALKSMEVALKHIQFMALVLAHKQPGLKLDLRVARKSMVVRLLLVVLKLILLTALAHNQQLDLNLGLNNMDLKLLLEVTLKLIPLTVLARKCMDLNPDPLLKRTHPLDLEAKLLPVALKTTEVALKLKLIRLTDPVLNQLDPNLDLDLDLDLDLLVAPKPKPKALKLTLLMALVHNH